MRTQALPKPIAAVGPETPERRLWRAQRQWMEQHGDTRFTPEGTRRDRFGTLETMAEAAFDIAIAAAGLRRRAEASALDIRLVELELPLARLPAAFDGYSILHLSDLHLDGHPALIDRMLAAAGGAAADLVVLTGDYLFANGGSHDAIVAPARV